MLKVTDNKGQSWDSNPYNQALPVGYSVLKIIVTYLQLFLAKFTSGLILDEIPFGFFIHTKLVFFLSFLFFFLSFLFSFVIHFLPVVTVKRADSRARVYGFIGVFFWKTGNRYQLRSWDVVIIQ